MPRRRGLSRTHVPCVPFWSPCGTGGPIHRQSYQRKAGRRSPHDHEPQGPRRRRRPVDAGLDHRPSVPPRPARPPASIVGNVRHLGHNRCAATANPVTHRREVTARPMQASHLATSRPLLPLAPPDLAARSASAAPGAQAPASGTLAIGAPHPALDAPGATQPDGAAGDTTIIGGLARSSRPPTNQMARGHSRRRAESRRARIEDQRIAPLRFVCCPTLGAGPGLASRTAWCEA